MKTIKEILNDTIEENLSSSHDLTSAIYNQFLSFLDSKLIKFNILNDKYHVEFDDIDGFGTTISDAISSVLYDINERHYNENI